MGQSMIACRADRDRGRPSPSTSPSGSSRSRPSSRPSPWCRLKDLFRAALFLARDLPGVAGDVRAAEGRVPRGRPGPHLRRRDLRPYHLRRPHDQGRGARQPVQPAQASRPAMLAAHVPATASASCYNTDWNLLAELPGVGGVRQHGPARSAMLIRRVRPGIRGRLRGTLLEGQAEVAQGYANADTERIAELLLHRTTCSDLRGCRRCASAGGASTSIGRPLAASCPRGSGVSHEPREPCVSS